MSSPKINEISGSREKTGIALILLKNTSQRVDVIYCMERLKRISGPVQHTYLTKKFNQPLAQDAYPSILSCRSLIPIKVCKLIFITSKLLSEFVSVSDESICPSLFCNSIIHFGISVQRLWDTFHFQSLLFERDIQ